MPSTTRSAVRAGEELVRQLGERFVKCVGDATAVARIGPDRFAAILFHLNEEREVGRAIEEWRRHWLGAPFRVLGQESHLTPGPARRCFRATGAMAPRCSKNAEAALNKARDTGETHMFYTHGWLRASLNGWAWKAACAALCSARSSYCITSPRSTWSRAA